MCLAPTQTTEELTKNIYENSRKSLSFYFFVFKRPHPKTMTASKGERGTIVYSEEDALHNGRNVDQASFT